MRLAGEPFVECVPLWHSDPSWRRFHSKNIARDFVRSNGMYCVVHVAPLAVKGWFWRLCADAVGGEEDARRRLLRVFAARAVRVCRSSLFFVCFSHLSKLVQCYWRHYVVRADPVWSSLACVYVATLLAECFETPQRRVQYTLYTATHVLRMAARALELKCGGRLDARLYEWWSVLMLQLTFVIWSFIRQIGRSEQFCWKWSLTAMDIVL